MFNTERVRDIDTEIVSYTTKHTCTYIDKQT